MQKIRLVVVLCQVVATLVTWASQHMMDVYLIAGPIAAVCFAVIASATLALSVPIERYESSL